MIRGLVLAGGKSSRFGTDKALATYQGASFLERAVSLLEGLRLEPVVIARRGQDYPFLTCPVLHDKLPDLGPLGGLYTAMTVFKKTSFLVLTCDMPALTSVVLMELLEAHQPGVGVTAYAAESGIQPFPGLYGPSLFKVVQNRIKEDSLSMQGLLDRVPEKNAIVWRGPREVFRNINRRDDLIPSQ